MRAKIELARINNRLVHEQVDLTRGSTLSIDTIVVVDNLTAASSLAQELMQSVTSATGHQIRFYAVHDLIRAHSDNTSHQKLFVAVQSPHGARLLVEAGIELKYISADNMRCERGRAAFNQRVYLTQPDIEDINYVISQGIEVFYQGAPGLAVEKLSELDRETMGRRG